MSKLANASIAALERELDRRRQRIAKLKEQRQRIVEQLEAIDAELAKLTCQGAQAKPPATPSRSARSKRKGKRKAKPGRRQVLADAIRLILSEADSPLRAGEIAQEIKRRGVKTRSSNVPNLVRVALRRVPGVKRVGRGLYRAGK